MKTPFEVNELRDEAFNAGIDFERKRIIELLENEIRQCEKAGLWANGIDLRGQLQELHLGLTAALEVIRGDNK